MDDTDNNETDNNETDESQTVDGSGTGDSDGNGVDDSIDNYFSGMENDSAYTDGNGNTIGGVITDSEGNAITSENAGSVTWGWTGDETDYSVGEPIKEANDKVDADADAAKSNDFDIAALNTDYFQDFINNSERAEEVAKMEEAAQEKADTLSQIAAANAASGNQLAYTGDDVRALTLAYVDKMDEINAAKTAASADMASRGVTPTHEILNDMFKDQIREAEDIERRAHEMAADIRAHGETSIPGISSAREQEIIDRANEDGISLAEAYTAVTGKSADAVSEGLSSLQSRVDSAERAADESRAEMTRAAGATTPAVPSGPSLSTSSDTPSEPSGSEPTVVDTPLGPATVTSGSEPTGTTETDVPPEVQEVADSLGGTYDPESGNIIVQNEDGSFEVYNPDGTHATSVGADGSVTLFHDDEEEETTTPPTGEDEDQDSGSSNSGSEQDMQEAAQAMSTKTGFVNTVNRVIGKDTKLGQYLLEQYESGPDGMILGETITALFDQAFGDQVGNFVANAGDLKGSIEQSKTGIQQMKDAINNKDMNGFWKSVGSFLKGLGNLLIGAGRTIWNGVQMVGNVVMGLVHLLSNFTGFGALANMFNAGQKRLGDFLNSIQKGLGVDENTAKQIADSLGAEDAGTERSAAVTKKVGWNSKNKSATNVSDYNKGLGEEENNVTSDFHKKVIKYLPHARLAVKKWRA